MKFSLASYIFWFATASGQALLLSRWRRLPQLLIVYLFGELILTAIGIPVSLFADRHFADVWRFASCADDILSTFLVIAAWQVARERSRTKYRNPLIVFAVATLSLSIALSATDLPLQQLEGHSGQVVYAMAHVWWTWLNILFGFLPLYCLIGGCAINRRVLLVLLGVGSYLAVHAGVVDYLIDTRFLHHFSAGVVSTTAYFFSLVLWFCSAASIPRETSHQ